MKCDDSKQKNVPIYLTEPSASTNEYWPLTTSPSRSSAWDLMSPVWGSLMP